MPLLPSRLTSLLLFTASMIATVGIFYTAAWLLRPSMDAPPARSAAEIAEAQAARTPRLKPTEASQIHREVDYAAGRTAPWWPKGESPVLAELVQQGRLPPVEERTGSEPLVEEGVEGIGRFGGSWYRVATSDQDSEIITGIMSGATLVRWSPQGDRIVPHVAKGWQSSPDAREYTVFLRRGMRWSDGAPFTADDILFWWEKDVRYFSGSPRWMQVGGKPGKVVKVDDFTVKFVFPEPNGLFLQQLAGANTYALPIHYVERYHPGYGDQELIQRTMRTLALTSPLAVYARIKNTKNPECPRLWPWVRRTHQTRPPYVYVRNPYFWAVDPAGNQLPYLDRVLFDLKTQAMIAVSAASGEISMQERHLKFEDYTMLMNGRERGGYQVYHWYPATRSAYTVSLNLNRRIEPDRPETARKHELINDVRFRRALSLALNRRDIIRAEYSNIGSPAQLDPGPDSPFHHPPLFNSYTAHDPATANRLLDEIGLTRRDGEGYRTFADGTRMTFYLFVTEITGPGPAQFLIDDWAAVGVRVVLRDRAYQLFLKENNSYAFDFAVFKSESEFLPLLEPRNLVPVSLDSFFAPAFGVWYQDGGLWDMPLSRAPRALKPPADHPLLRAMHLLQEARGAATQEEQVRIFREALQIAADNVWTISLSTPPPDLVVVKNGFRNVPRVALSGIRFNSPAITGIETYFWESPHDSPGAVAQVKAAVETITPDPDLHRATPAAESAAARGPTRWLGRVAAGLAWGVAGLGLLLAALRHPFIARRLALMGPTLLIIAVVSFIIIQLPPGDYLSTRIAELELTGDQSAIEEVESLKTLFHVDDPPPLQFARWLGLVWFTSFDNTDLGLLQGHLGRSMENGELVNTLVGDRIMLTVLISLFTILFTWSIALPLGIYSAVRPYSAGDYALTLLGFIGMSVPGFLLALLLIYASQRWLGIEITGLFSAEYAARPEWTWGKFVDLLRHIWLPVVVLGLAGTAGMMRVMRANLLDELRKPYVTTARAKGVRPLRLLLKYPVRLALNPFISGIGGLFPQLISGGAIVALVLSLPTVGPLMLSALMKEDMYLAGSMLMVLSLLSVAGTLVSDLLLLMLDPRIRMEGGTR